MSEARASDELARPIVVVGTRRWHEILLLAYGAYVGWVALHSPPPSISSYFPRWEVVVWAVLLLVSGGIHAATAIWWRSIRAQRIRIGALLMNTGAVLLYVVAVFSMLPDHWAALRAAGWIVAWAAANVFEAVQSHLSLRGL